MKISTNRSKWHILHFVCHCVFLFASLLYTSIFSRGYIILEAVLSPLLVLPRPTLEKANYYHWLSFKMFKILCIKSLQGSMLSKLPTISKNALNSSCWKLNFLQKNSAGAHVCRPRSGTMGFQRLPCFKYYNVLKWESRFTLGFERYQNYRLYRKTLHIKVVEN